MHSIRFDFEYRIIRLSLLFPAYGVPEPEQTVFSNCDRKTDASFFHNADNTGSEFLSKASMRRMWRDRTRKVCFCRQLLPFRFAHTVLLYRNQVRAFAARRAVGDRSDQPRWTIRVSPGFPTTTERTDSRMENVAGKVFVGCLSYPLPPIQPHHREQKCRNDISQPQYGDTP